MFVVRQHLTGQYVRVIWDDVDGPSYRFTREIKEATWFGTRDCAAFACPPMTCAVEAIE